MSPHTASQKYSFDWRRLFPRPLRVSDPLILWRPSTVTISPKHRQQRRTLVDNSTSWRAPPPYFPSYLLTKQPTAHAKSEWSSIGPAFVELRALTRTSTAWKIPTHNSRSRRPSFSVLMLRPQELWSLKKASLHYFRRPCHHLKVALPWFSSAFGFSIVVSCNLQAEASVTGRGRAAVWSISKEVFFFRYFRKKLRARATRNKENNNSGLSKKNFLANNFGITTRGP